MQLKECLVEYIDRTDRGVTRPQLSHLSVRSETLRAPARDFSLRTERWNNVGRVGPRYVLFFLYIKHDQMIDKVDKISLSLLLRAEARGRAYPIFDFHWFVVLND